MSVGRQVTDGFGPHTKSRPPLCRLHCDQAGMAERNSAHTVCLTDVVHIKPKASETYGHAGHCKQTIQGPSNMPHTCPGFRAVSHTTHSQTLGTCCIGPRFAGWPQHWMWAVTPASGSTVTQMKEVREGPWAFNFASYFSFWPDTPDVRDSRFHCTHARMSYVLNSYLLTITSAVRVTDSGWVGHQRMQ